jgi:hypothetical protein
MRRSLFMFIVVAAVAARASTAAATTTITIDGHFKETQPKGAPPPLCFNGALGIGQLKGLGKACEQFTFESFDGFDANGCAMVTGTDTFTLDDAQQSSFTEREHDTACHPGNSQQAPGQRFSYGSPGVDSGTWRFLAGTGTGVFANVCAGSGDLSLQFGGAAGVPVYSGKLTLC